MARERSSAETSGYLRVSRSTFQRMRAAHPELAPRMVSAGSPRVDRWLENLPTGWSTRGGAT